MKTGHSQLSEPDVISVFVGTWNMGKLSFLLANVTRSSNSGIRRRRAVLINHLLCCFVYAGGSPPPHTLQTWMTCCGLGHTPDETIALLPHDFYAVGTQENPQGEREWTEHIKTTLRSYTQIDFKQVIILFLTFSSISSPHCLKWVHYLKSSSNHFLIIECYGGAMPI